MDSFYPDTAYAESACPACGSKNYKREYTGIDHMFKLAGTFYVGRCADCGLLFQNPRLKPEHLGKHYPDDYGPYASGEIRLHPAELWHLKRHQGYSHLPQPPRSRWLRRLWARNSGVTKLIPDFVEDGSVLEIACASGNKLALLKSLGWKHCSGIEYSEYSSGQARNRGFQVFTGRVEDALSQVPDGSQDAIIAGFVLEHLENPFELVARLADKLKPGGQLLFSTLNIDSPDYRLYKTYWYDLDLPRHFVFFRRRDLVRMLGNRFRILGTGYLPATNDYVKSAEYRLRHEPKAIDRVIAKLGARLLPVCMLLTLIGQASRICIHARKI
jgi:SAM-dependent methyltransferase